MSDSPCLVPAEPGHACRECGVPAIICDLNGVDDAFYCGEHTPAEIDRRPGVENKLLRAELRKVANTFACLPAEVEEISFVPDFKAWGKEIEELLGDDD